MRRYDLGDRTWHPQVSIIACMVFTAGDREKLGPRGDRQAAVASVIPLAFSRALRTVGVPPECGTLECGTRYFSTIKIAGHDVVPL